MGSHCDLPRWFKITNLDGASSVKLNVFTGWLQILSTEIFNRLCLGSLSLTWICWMCLINTIAYMLKNVHRVLYDKSNLKSGFFCFWAQIYQLMFYRLEVFHLSWKVTFELWELGFFWKLVVGHFPEASNIKVFYLKLARSLI